MLFSLPLRMSAPATGGRFTVFRLHRAAERNILRRHARQARHESSTPQPPKNNRNASTVTSEPKLWTIPIPLYPWLSPIAIPFRAYGRAQRRAPLLVQLCSTLTIYVLGDLSAQTIATSGFDKAPGYEPERSLRALIIGGLISIPSYRYFLFLGRNFNYSSHALSLAVKIVVNQTFFTPLFNTYFFGMQSLLAGASLEDAWRRVRETVPVSWKNSWKVWPAVTAFSFTFIAPQNRSVFAGVIAIGWQSYLSWLNKMAEQRGDAHGVMAQGESSEDMVSKVNS